MMRVAVVLLYISWNVALAGQASRLTDEQLRKGVNLLPYPDPGDEDPRVIVRRYQGLRTSDVIDAMQAIGLQDRGVMDHDIRPLRRDTTDQLAHRIYGVAITYQYVPTNKPAAAAMPYEEFRKWHSHWYQHYAPELFSRILKPGHVVVIDAQGIENTGFVGSNNALSWRARGAVGVVTNGPCRDSDELILQRIPVYSKYIGGGTRPGRIEAAAINRPVVVGGVLVRPGDVVVADGYGVVVVPREHAERVAEIAWDIAKGDKESRRKLYEKTGLKPDATVR
ncbi:MAG: RraA family protein [Bryobacterales bacterium]|nr:RraA family protein [Bryobacteraceae bacterium]MDW8128951.1 RraA family protein [Bryobacterales bacterium]